MDFLEKIGILQKILSKAHKNQIYLLILLMLIGALFEIFSIGALLPFFTILLDSEANNINNNLFLSITSFTNKYIDGDNALYFFLISIILIFFIKFLYLVFLTNYQIRFSYRVYNDVSQRLLKGYTNLDYKEYLKRNASDIIHNIQIEINFLVGTFLLPLLILLTEIIIILFISVFLLLFFFDAFLITILFYTISILAYLKFTKNKNLNWGANRQFYEKKRIKFLHDIIQNLRDIRLFKATEYFLNNHEEYLKKTNKYIILQQTFQYIPSRVMEFISILGFVILVIFLKYNSYTNGEILIIAGIFVTGGFKILPSLNKVISSMQNIRFSKKSIELINSELNKCSSTQFSFYLKENYNLSESTIIYLNNVSHNFEGSKTPLFQNVNLEIKKNSFVGLIGKSGSGKSSLLNIIIGLIKPNKGSANINPKNIKSKNRIALVPQEVSLIDGTIKQNIVFGNSESEVDEDRFNLALKNSQLDQLIQNLSDGVNTFVGDRGSKLSGGQRQRLGIARALYKGFDILILDEPTSSLDEFTENEFIKFLETLKGNQTIIISSHKMKILDNCDVVYKLDNYECRKV